MNPFQRLGVKISNWWRGEPQDSGGVVTLNSPSFLERIGLKRKGKPTSEVTYFTCLKMLSETLAKMPIKYYQKTDKGIIEAEATDTSKLLSKRPNPFMTPTTFWNTVEINRNHYGNGYVYEKEEFGRFLNSLEEIVQAGVHVVLTAHAQMRKFEQPDEMGAYDRYEMKLGKKTGSQISPLVKEWADMVLFANYKTFAVQTDDKGQKFKAQGGKRVMYTSHHPCWDAKNRFGLADELPFEYAQIAQCIGGKPVQAAQPTPTGTAVPMQQMNAVLDETPTEEAYSIPSYVPKALADLMRPEHVTAEEIQMAIGQKGYYPEDTPISSYDPAFVQGVLIGAWPKVFSVIRSNRDLPFDV